MGTGIGLLGFVTFFGGAILWTEIDSAGLPATEGVALVPKSVLLSTGAHFLTSAILLALFSVAVLWVYDEVLRDRFLGAAEKVEQRLVRASAELKAAHSEALNAFSAVQDAHAAAARAEAGTLEALSTAPGNTVYAEAAREAADASARLEQELLDAKERADQTERRLAEQLPGLEQKTQEVRSRLARRELWMRLTLLGLPLLGLELLLTTFAPLAWYDYVILVALSATTTSLILIVYAYRDHFAWFAVSAFLAIGTYMGFTTYFRTRDDPEAEPAAALVDGRTPIVGYFIAQTSDRIYLGIPSGGGLPGRMIELRRNDVVALAIGQSTPIHDHHALDAAMLLRTSLCAGLTTDSAAIGPVVSQSATPACRAG
ncbi:MAG TPA: hypothetical protein VK680_13900 [Solirubrobacteraceae bacterium]|nr:hypothetical protein [Solirubrobacteraceae bacterium]